MRVALIGYGRMGKLVETCIGAREGWSVAGIVDPTALPRLSRVDAPDVAIDFSFPGDLDGLLADAIAMRTPLVIGRTGLSAAQDAAIADAARTIPIVQASNFSVGVAVMRRVAREMALALGDGFDIEITETHHKMKLDAPSGTALSLLHAIDPDGARPVLHGREGIGEARGREIGMHALRGGSVCGEHTVHFFGDMETLSLTHRAEDRGVFATGAVRAAAFAASQPPGLYGMEDVLFTQKEA